MSFTLAGTDIKSPGAMQEGNSTQVAQNQALDGTISRDYFGSNKRMWVLTYRTIPKSDYDTINSIYQSYLSTGNPVTFVSTETNYVISQTNVHVDLQNRDFTYRGDQYLSDFTLILTEN